ncbi:hypothetical protein CAPTEDRAFT_207761 [Capitella teleta]|uniref:Methyltransferase FkbM domain-containing protein n=1 Tax=Capitella teleta TaxID=283909 RepID=R7TWW3_CAPTE|nr:hypothetical protein CAPTEDRAFT_207761 [Capitella teleta]|eukprot:ELT98097.1 hypothetical protein CAPTEDRAFT_207761 [Capitella teleta]
MAWSKEDMRNGNARQRASPHRKALIVSCVFLTLLFVYTYGITVIRFFAPCPSRSELEFQLRDFIKYRSSQTKSEQDKDAAMKNLTGANVAWNDPKLVSVVKNHFVDPPRPYVTKFSLPLTQTPQAKAADAILKGKTAGFFLECGGLDGERSSNTLWLEQKRDWNGVLIEMDPSYYMQLRGKNRKCYSINACLSPNGYPDTLSFREHELGEGQLVSEVSSGMDIHRAYCLPFRTIMLALNRTKIDYLSLDVEGWELPILRTVDFDQIDISVISVEIKHGKGGGQAYTDFLESKGFIYHSHLHFHDKVLFLGGNDYIFVNKNLKV